MQKGCRQNLKPAKTGKTKPIQASTCCDQALTAGSIGKITGMQKHWKYSPCTQVAAALLSRVKDGISVFICLVNFFLLICLVVFEILSNLASATAQEQASQLNYALHEEISFSHTFLSVSSASSFSNSTIRSHSIPVIIAHLHVLSTSSKSFLRGMVTRTAHGCQVADALWMSLFLSQ